ncbi:hypothetical protein GCM10010502_46380 [Kitasatospora aureofaciens]|uniref:Uncharacterized protein n=1 Tax=Kitasatospora aureofaciens TaxID=1894 RepID=A0A8H9LNW6_KITAU|nr:hypothetical protein GCM10010502_46380 [Kitasatospora aureofaciens]
MRAHVADSSEGVTVTISVPWCQDRTRRTHRVSADGLRAAPYRARGRIVSQWQSHDHRDLSISINVSGVGYGGSPPAPPGSMTEGGRGWQAGARRAGPPPEDGSGPPGRQAAASWASAPPVPVLPGVLVPAPEAARPAGR